MVPSPDRLADYGRNLVWGGALQGVTELEERERCKDDWWNGLRRGELSEENWRYLHGKPVEGCRLSRRRVTAGPGDPRLGEEKFRWAAAIVANNDAKWPSRLDAPSAEVLQTQARGGAGEKGQGARGASLRAQECDKAARIRWLDRDTENLSLRALALHSRRARGPGAPAEAAMGRGSGLGRIPGGEGAVRNLREMQGEEDAPTSPIGSGSASGPTGRPFAGQKTLSGSCR